MSNFPLSRADEETTIDVITRSPVGVSETSQHDRSRWRWEGQHSAEESDSSGVKKMLSQEAEELDTLEKELAEKIYKVQVFLKNCLFCSVKKYLHAPKKQVELEKLFISFRFLFRWKRLY